MHSEPTVAGNPPFHALIAFEAVARLGSYSEAATRLATTHSTVSRRIAALERWLGFRLFERGPRGATLTPDGARYLGDVRRALALLTHSSEQWRAARIANRVVIGTVPSFAAFALIPALAAIESMRPSLRADLVISHKLTEFGREQADLTIRYGAGDWPGVIAVPLYVERVFPIGSRALAKSLGADARGDALLAHPLLHDGNEHGWREWFAAGGIAFRGRRGDRRFEDYPLVLDAAAAGLGVALARLPFAENAIRQRGLVALSHAAVISQRTFHLVRAPVPPRDVAREFVRRLTLALALKRQVFDRFAAT